MRSTRLAGASPSPTPARVFAPVLAPRYSAPRFLRVSRATYSRAWAPLPLLARRGREQELPPRAQVSVSPRVGPAAGHTCQLERLQPGQPRKVSGGGLAVCVFGGGFSLSIVWGEAVLGIAPNLVPFKLGAH